MHIHFIFLNSFESLFAVGLLLYICAQKQLINEAKWLGENWRLSCESRGKTNKGKMARGGRRKVAIAVVYSSHPPTYTGDWALNRWGGTGVGLAALYAQGQFILTFHSPRKLPVLLVLRALVGCWPCAGVPPQPTVCAAIIIPPTPTSGCDWPPILVCSTVGEEAVASPGADEGEGNTYRQIGAEMRVQSS
jgi:hypothetical protein